MKISLCILTLNELQGCQNDIPQLPMDKFEEVYAIDGGSSDGTCEWLTDAGIRVIRQENPGYNNAYISAFNHCKNDAVLFYHPKGSIDPKVVSKFRRYLEQGYSLVVGSRIVKGSVNEEDSRLLKPRKWFVFLLGLLSSIVWKQEGNTILDVLHGLRAVRIDAISKIQPLTRGCSIDLELVVRSYKHRLAIIEFPVTEKPRLHGQTHFNAFPTGKSLFNYLLFELFRKKASVRWK